MARDRVRIADGLRRDVMGANRAVCCVCKRRGLGVNLHHIDGDPSNNHPSNLAVVCVSDHDRHHRPGAYVTTHPELTPELLRMKKSHWESTVASTGRGEGRVVALVSWHAHGDDVYAVRVDYQLGADMVLERLWHITEADLNTIADRVVEDVVWLEGTEHGRSNGGVRICNLTEAIELDYCDCGGGSFGRTLDPVPYAHITDPRWAENAFATVYINPDQASLAVRLIAHAGAPDDDALAWSMHRCGNDLHVRCDDDVSLYPIKRRPSVRLQARELVNGLLFGEYELDPARVLIGTGDPDEPHLINRLDLPVHWERRAKRH